ncbi:type II toxin-antitoxin system RelB/DinJ family antitoxin [bacterium]|nr:type II toxin-antitoxin system RelB/DinJ family antitoxin [bacterium]
MSQANICIRLDENLKKQFDYLCNEFGLTMTAAINMFIKAVIRESKIPFEISANVPNAETRQAIEDIENGIGLSKPYTDIEEMFRDMALESDEEDA